jgi:hypothetical protein
LIGNKFIDTWINSLNFAKTLIEVENWNCRFFVCM